MAHMYLANLMLLGSGELGREFAIAAKRLGCRIVACDRYDNAPAMQVADAREVFPMLDGAALRTAVEKHRPDYIVLMESFVRNGLALDPRFDELYAQVNMIPTDYYGSGMLLFQRRDLAGP